MVNTDIVMLARKNFDQKHWMSELLATDTSRNLDG